MKKQVILFSSFLVFMAFSAPTYAEEESSVVEYSEDDVVEESPSDVKTFSDREERKWSFDLAYSPGDREYEDPRYIGSLKGDDPGTRLRVGYKFDEYRSITLGYGDYGSAVIFSNKSPGTLNGQPVVITDQLVDEISLMFAGMKFEGSYTEELSMHFELGITNYDISMDAVTSIPGQSASTSVGSDGGMGFYGRIGGEYMFHEDYYFGIEFEGYRFELELDPSSNPGAQPLDFNATLEAPVVSVGRRF